MTSNVIGPSREIVTNSAPSSESVRFCKDCKWFVPYDNPDRMELGKCSHKSAERHWAKFADSDGLVTGELRFSFARNERSRANGCGLEATLFEPKPVEHPAETVTAREASNKPTDSAYISALILIIVAFASAIVTALCIKGLDWK